MAVRDLETKLSYKFLKWILYALLLTPLWVWSIFLFPFITTKILYFRILVELALLLYIPLALEFPEIRPKWHLITKAVWIYVAVVLLTSLFGVDFNRSFWGSIERGEGIITLLHFASYFTILTGVFGTKPQWRRYIGATVLVSAFVALYGAGQLLCPGCDWFVQTGGGTRVSATIGNAAFFAAYMIFGVFLSLYLTYETQSKSWKWFWWALLSFELFMLFQSQTRGGILAAALALVLYFGFNIFQGQRKSVRWACAGLLLLFISFGILIYSNPKASWVRSNNTLHRLATISTRDITTESRFDTWQASFRGFKDRFVLGYGYENYQIAFNKYFPARIFKDSGSQIWFDRAHNLIFDIAVTSGVSGLLAYAGILAAVYASLWQTFRKARTEQANSPIIPVILGLLLAAYVLQNLFVFDTQATYLMFFLVLALVGFLKEAPAPSKKQKPPRSLSPGVVVASILTAVILVIFYYVNFKPARANYFATQGIKVSKQGQYQKVKPVFQKALSYGTYMDQEIRQRLVDHGLEALGSGQLSAAEQEEAYLYLISELEKSLKESPRDVKNYLYLMTVLNRLPNNPGFPNRVLALGEEALKLSGTRAQIYFETGQAYFFLKEFDKGLAEFQKAVSLNPRTKETRFNYLLGAIVANVPELIDSEREFLTSTLGYKFTSRDYQAMARAYAQAGAKQKVIATLSEALQFDPGDLLLRAGLAAAYGEVCDLARARAEVEELVKLSQTYERQGFEFIRVLEQKCGK